MDVFSLDFGVLRCVLRELGVADYVTRVYNIWNKVYKELVRFRILCVIWLDEASLISSHLKQCFFAKQVFSIFFIFKIKFILLYAV